MNKSISGQFFGNRITFEGENSTFIHQEFSHFAVINDINVDMHCFYDKCVQAKAGCSFYQLNMVGNK